MKKFIGGFLLGSLLSATFTYSLLRTESPVTTVETAAMRQTATAPVKSNAKASDASTTGPRSIVMTPSPPYVDSNNQHVVAENSTPARQPPQNNSAPTSVVPALPRSAMTQSSNVFEPIPVSDAHRAIINGDPTFAQGHADLELQTRDDSWSYYMEQMLGSYFASRTPGTGVEIVNIACRATSCEILAYSETGTPAFDVLLQPARKEPWWDFVSSSGRSSDAHGRLTIVMFLERAPKDRSRLRQPKETLSRAAHDLSIGEVTLNPPLHWRGAGERV